MTTISALRASTWKMMRMGMPPESMGMANWVVAAPNTYRTVPVVSTFQASARPTAEVARAPSRTQALRTARPAPPTIGIKKAANRGTAINSAGKCRMTKVSIINL